MNINLLYTLLLALNIQIITAMENTHKKEIEMFGSTIVKINYLEKKHQLTYQALLKNGKYVVADFNKASILLL